MLDLKDTSKRQMTLKSERQMTLKSEKWASNDFEKWASNDFEKWEEAGVKWLWKVTKYASNLRVLVISLSSLPTIISSYSI